MKKLKPGKDYGALALEHLENIRARNQKTIEKIARQVEKDVAAGRSLLVFGSGHSSIFPMELHHRAGGASFVIPLVADYLLPTAGPPIVRLFERSTHAADAILARARPKRGEM